VQCVECGVYKTGWNAQSATCLETFEKERFCSFPPYTQRCHRKTSIYCFCRCRLPAGAGGRPVPAGAGRWAVRLKVRPVAGRCRFSAGAGGRPVPAGAGRCRAVRLKVHSVAGRCRWPAGAGRCRAVRLKVHPVPACAGPIYRVTGPGRLPVGAGGLGRCRLPAGAGCRQVPVGKVK